MPEYRSKNRAWRTVIVLAAVVFSLDASMAAANAQDSAPAINAGVLTCVVSPGTKEPFGVERELSCNFKPITGVAVDFVGVVKRLGAEVPSDNKIVLAWSVLAPSAHVAPSHLEGDYVGSLSSKTAKDDTSIVVPGLIGGKNSSISLQPLNATTAEGGKSTLAVLELKLSKIKV